MQNTAGFHHAGAVHNNSCGISQNYFDLHPVILPPFLAHCSITFMSIPILFQKNNKTNYKKVGNMKIFSQARKVFVASTPYPKKD